MMSEQKYTRTRFEEDEMSGAGSPQPMEYNTTVVLKRGPKFMRGRSWLECILLGLLAVFTLIIIILAAVLSSRDHQITTLKQNGSKVITVDKVKVNSKHSVTYAPDEDKDKCPSLCVTPACVTVSSTLINSMDTTADPCTDFYQYACGGWIDKHIIPSGHSRWSSFGELWQDNQEVMRKVIEKPLNESDSDAEKKAKLYYLSCLDKNKTITKLGGKPLQGLIREKGGWSISNKTGFWDVKKFDFQTTIEKSQKPLNESDSDAEKKAKLYYLSCLDKNKTIAKLGGKPLQGLIREKGGWSISNKTGFWNIKKFDFQTTIEKTQVFGILFSFYVSADEKNSSQNILEFDLGGLGLERDFYLNKTIDEDKVLSAYLDYMTKVGVLLGGEENNTRAQMRDVIEFEADLAEITIPNDQRRNDAQKYHKMTINELQSLAPFMNWLHFVNSMLSLGNLTVNASEKVVVYFPKYFQNLTSLVQNTLAKDNGKRIMNNYMVWHVVKAMTPYLSDDFTNARNILTEALSGTVGGEELWRHCISDTDKVLGFALGSMFVREVFKGDNKQKAESMIEEVKMAFKNNLPHLKWMDDETRAAAVDKANAVIDMIGFPEYILNRTRLNNEYKQLKINASEYFMNNIRNLQVELQENMEQLRKTPEPFEWDMTPPTVNAYYTPTKNEIVFPAGILQAPFYDENWPKSLNFGAMGVVMGHELTHGFDDEGREYDKFGNLRPWWNNDSIAKFEERTKCMVDQYSEYKLNGENVRGNQTLGENIADNGGLKAAYYAYEDWLSKHAEEAPLPGVNLTHRQLFFLSFAHVWCSVSTPEADHLSIVGDEHSPAKFRVIGTLSNSHEFAEQYNCPKNSPMNPDKKCEVW